MFTTYLTERGKNKQKKGVISTISILPITSLTKEVIKYTVIKKLLPSIKEMLTRDTMNTIIQLGVERDYNIEHDTYINRKYLIVSYQ